MIHLNFYRAWYIVGFARKSIGSLGFCWAIHNFGIWVCPATCHRRKKHITVNWQKSDRPLALKNGIPRMVIPWWQDMAHHKPRSHVIQLFHTWPYHQVVMLCHVCEGSIVMLCHHVMPSIYVNSHHTIKWPSMCHSTSRDCASCDIATSWSQVATKLWTKPPRPPQMFIISRLVLNSFGLFWNGSELMIYCNVFQNIFSVYNIYIYTYI